MKNMFKLITGWLSFWLACCFGVAYLEACGTPYVQMDGGQEGDAVVADSASASDAQGAQDARIIFPFGDVQGGADVQTSPANCVGEQAPVDADCRSSCTGSGHTSGHAVCVADANGWSSWDCECTDTSVTDAGVQQDAQVGADAQTSGSDVQVGADAQAGADVQTTSTGCESNPDRGQIGTSCANGLRGECRRLGHFVCLGTEVVCDAPATVYGTDESCNGLDDNCNGIVDDVLTGSCSPVTDAQVATDAVVTDAGCASPANWYLDADHDTFGNSAGVPFVACFQPSGYVADHTDCDDTSATRRPGAAESCNTIDDNCNAVVDEGSDGLTGTICPCTSRAWYGDADGDGYPRSDVSTMSCTAPTAYIAARADGRWDCNDGAFTANPGATENCSNMVDDDCDGVVNDGCTAPGAVDRYRYTFLNFRSDIGAISSPELRPGDWSTISYISSTTASQPYVFEVPTRLDNFTLRFTCRYGVDCSIVEQTRDWGYATSTSVCGSAPVAQIRLEHLAADGRLLETIYVPGGLQPPIVIVAGNCRLGR